jgi:hypothetical protein
VLARAVVHGLQPAVELAQPARIDLEALQVAPQRLGRLGCMDRGGLYVAAHGLELGVELRGMAEA